MTPTASYADFTALSQLPKVKLKVTDRSERKGEEEVTHVTLENPSKSLAFFVRLKVDKGAKGEEILPVVWEDNYISLHARREARSHGDVPRQRAGRGQARGRSQRLERGVKPIG